MEQNTLYPIFLKPQQLEILVVGGGHVAAEKMKFLLKSSPDARVTLVAPYFRAATMTLAKACKATVIDDVFKKIHLKCKHMVIATTDSPEVNLEVYKMCRKRHILVNVADNPPYCDFYMGGIVTKGQVKIAISTNGKSPTMAKRLRQFFEAVLPENINDLVNNLHTYRSTLKGDFQEKVTTLNTFTKALITHKNTPHD